MSIFDQKGVSFLDNEESIVCTDNGSSVFMFTPVRSDIDTEEKDFYQIASNESTDDPSFQAIINQYQGICQKHMGLLENVNSNTTRDQFLLRSERNTWRLLFELCKRNEELLKDQYDGISIEATSEYEELHKLGLEDKELRDFKVVLNWLEAIAEENVAYSDTERTMLSRTIAAISARAHSYEDLVHHVDPDSVRREELNIQQDDMDDEIELFKGVWCCIRCGNYDKAIQLSIQAGQSWLAASLSGGQACGTQESTEPDDEPSLIRWGNPNRFLWKAMCWKLSEHKIDEGNRLQVYERAIYAALSNNTKCLLQSPLCQSWEDYCWVYFKSEVDNREDAVLHAHALHLLNKTRHTGRPLTSKYFDGAMRASDDSSSSIFQKLASSSNKEIRLSSVEFYHMVQTHLIESYSSNVISVMWDFICENDNQWNLNLNESLKADQFSQRELRFAAHLVLYFFSCKEDFNYDHGYMLLKAYIRRLVLNRRNELIPFYTAQLPETGCIQVYAEVLLAIDERERHECLQNAKKFISASVLPAITKLAVENSISGTSQNDHRLRAIELLCTNPSERAEAMVQSNVLVRQLVAQGDLANVTILLEKILPMNSLVVIESVDQTVDPQYVDTAAREHIMWKAYLRSQAHYNAWRECSARWNLAESWLFDEERHCLAEISMVFNNAVQSILDVLKFENGWLLGVDSVYQMSNFDNLESARLRKKVLPQLVFDLHAVYLTTAMTIASFHYHDEKARATDLLKKSLELCVLSSSDRFHVFSALSVQDTKRLLKLTNTTVMEIMKLQNDIEALFET